MTKTKLSEIAEKLKNVHILRFNLDESQIDEMGDNSPKNKLKLNNQKQQQKQQAQSIKNSQQGKITGHPVTGSLRPLPKKRLVQPQNKPKPIPNFKFNDAYLDKLEQLAKNDKARNSKERILKGDFDEVGPISKLPDEYRNKIMKGKIEKSYIRTPYNKDTGEGYEPFQRTGGSDDYDKWIENFLKSEEKKKKNLNKDISSSYKYPFFKTDNLLEDFKDFLEENYGSRDIFPKETSKIESNKNKEIQTVSTKYTNKEIIECMMHDITGEMNFPHFLNESLIDDDVLNAMVKEAMSPSQPILNESKDELVEMMYEDYLAGNLDESLFKSIIGGISGLLFGQKVGELICKILGIGNGPLKNLLTSKAVGTAIGYAIGKNWGKEKI